MSKNLRNCLKDLEFVSKIKCSKTQKSLLRYMSKNPKYYLAIKEIAVNIIKGNVIANSRAKTKSKRHKNVICAFAKNKNCLNKRETSYTKWRLALVYTFNYKYN